MPAAESDTEVTQFRTRSGGETLEVMKDAGGDRVDEKGRLRSNRSSFTELLRCEGCPRGSGGRNEPGVRSVDISNGWSGSRLMESLSGKSLESEGVWHANGEWASLCSSFTRTSDWAMWERLDL